MCDHSTPAEPVRYELRVEGQLGPEWSAWFAGLVVTPDADGTTRLTGPVIDQAALYGLLRQVRDLGLPLLAVNRVPLNDTQLVKRPGANPAARWASGHTHARHALPD